MYAVRGNSAHNKAGHDYGALDQIWAVVLDNQCMQKLSQGSSSVTPRTPECCPLL